MVHTSRIQQVQCRLRWLALLFFLFFFLPSFIVQPASRLLFLLGFWFCLLLLTHFSLHAQGKQHAGQLGSVFCLEEGCVSCSHGCCRFWRKVQAPASTMFSVTSPSLQLSSHIAPQEICMQLVGFNLLFGKRERVFFLYVFPHITLSRSQFAPKLCSSQNESFVKKSHK